MIADALQIGHASIEMSDQDRLPLGEVLAGELGKVVAHRGLNRIYALLVDLDQLGTFGLMLDEFLGGQPQALGADTGRALQLTQAGEDGLLRTIEQSVVKEAGFGLL